MNVLGEVNTTNLDDVLIKFKVFGRYHLTLIVLIFFAYITNSMYGTNFVFVTEDVGYRCKNPISPCELNNTNIFDRKQCQIRVPIDPGLTCDDENNTRLTPCTEFIYENPDSFVAEFQLACQEWKRTLIGTMQSFGNMFGLLITGPISDRIGRKKVLVIFGVIGAVVGVARSFFRNYWLYVTFAFLEGLLGDNYSPMFMIAMECTATRNRGLFYMFCDFGYPTGGIILPLIAWLVPYWRHYLIAIYMPAFLYLLYIYLIDESPRWLLSTGKKDKAVNILKKAAKTNKFNLEDSMLNNLRSEDIKSGTVGLPVLLKETFASKVIFIRFLICVVWWITSTFTNYGMQINSVDLDGNKYLNFSLVSAVDLPASMFVGLILTRFRRKVSLFWAFLIGAVFSFLQPIMPKDMQWLSLIIFLISKFTSTVFFTITYVFTSELFPTYTRNSMHALCSSLGRIGSILAPQTPLLVRYWTGLPSVLFGGMALIATMLTLLVPDTSNESLPDNVEQAEAMGSKTSDQTLLSPISLSKEH